MEQRTKASKRRQRSSPPPESVAPRPLWQGWTFRLLAILLFSVFVQAQLWSTMYFTGDEPHYVLSVISYVQDGDFNLFDNYTKEDFRKFGFESLTPQRVSAHRPGVIPSEHGTLFPLAISPFYTLGGIAGVRLTLMVLALALCLMAGAVVDAITGDRTAGTVSAFLLALCPSWQLQASRIYPEVPAAFLAVVAALIMARYERPARLAAAAAGFCITLLPFLYLKYSPLCAGIGLLALTTPAFRRNKAFWTGVAIAVFCSVWNLLRFAKEGAVGGDFTEAGFFQLTGSFERFWRMFFDRFHGVVVHQPVVGLCLWALPYYLLRARNRQTRIHAAIAVSLALYLLMYAPWTQGPGYSVPGRYLAAAIPFMCIIITIWAWRPDPLRRVRLGIVAALSLVPVAFYATSFLLHTRLDLTMSTYRGLFHRYWPSWEDPSWATVTMSTGLLGYWIVLLLIATKFAAHWRIEHSRQVTADAR